MKRENDKIFVVVDEIACFENIMKIAYNIIYSRIHERILQISMIRFIDPIEAGREFEISKVKRDDSDASLFSVNIRTNIQ